VACVRNVSNIRYIEFAIIKIVIDNIEVSIFRGDASRRLEPPRW